MRLTDLAIQRLQLSNGRQQTYFDDLLKGFGLRVSVGGSKSFVIMYGTRRQLKTLGRYPDLSLAEARRQAKEFMGEVAGRKTGQGPIISFTDARERFLEDARLRTKKSTFTEYDRLLRKHFTFAKPLGAITRADIMEVIEGLGGSPSSAAHAFMAMKVFLNWAVGRGLIQVSPMPRMRFAAPSRSRILSDTELVTVWKRAEEVGYPFGTVVQLLIFTGQRRGEIAGLRRSWIQDGWIEFPEGFCKNGRQHRVPLGPMAQVIIDSIPSNGDLLFPARGKPEQSLNGWSKAKTDFDKTLAIAPYTLHDLRRTFASNLAKLGVTLVVAEKLLNHVSGSTGGIVGVYNRHNYYREMQEGTVLIEDHLQTLT